MNEDDDYVETDETPGSGTDRRYLHNCWFQHLVHATLRQCYFGTMSCALMNAIYLAGQGVILPLSGGRLEINEDYVEAGETPGPATDHRYLHNKDV